MPDSSLPLLFQPLQLRELTLANRIVISPMCQHAAERGHATPWHLVHLGKFALGGAIWLSFHRPRSAVPMRPRGSTAVLSVRISPEPPRANLPR